MDVSTNATTDLIDFSGHWSSSDQTQVTRAVEAIETTRLSDAPSPHRAPWIVTRHQTEEGDVYVASRFGFTEVLRASGIDELAHKIRDFAPDGVSPGGYVPISRAG